MRIRKRKVPLPISLLSPIPLTDLNLFSRSSVNLTTNGNNNSSQPSDQLTCSDLHRSINDGNSCSSNNYNMTTKSDLLVKEEQVPQFVGCLGIGGVESVQKRNDACKKNITALGAATDSTCSNGPSLSSSNFEEKAKWCNEDKAMRMKKLKGSSRDQPTAKSINNDDNNNKGVNISGKKSGSKRGKTIMEGSRCSRVNGRGWRCCQPTLVGYSLCEHHLGKGRLRSMSSARGRPSSTIIKSKKTALGVSSSSEDYSPLMQLCEAAKKESDLMVNNNDNSFARKRVNNNNSNINKVGIVKARSLSSLLGQTSNITASSCVASDGVECQKESKIDT